MVFADSSTALCYKCGHSFTFSPQFSFLSVPSSFLSLCVGVLCLVTQLCPTLRDPLDCSLPSSSVHGIFSGKNTEWIAISFSRGSSRLRDRTRVSYVSCIAGRFYTIWAIRETHYFLIWNRLSLMEVCLFKLLSLLACSTVLEVLPETNKSPYRNVTFYG